MRSARTVTIDRVPFTIIGVTPPRFFGPVVGRTFDVAVAARAPEPLVRGRDSMLNDAPPHVVAPDHGAPQAGPDARKDRREGAARRATRRSARRRCRDNLAADQLAGYLREGTMLAPARRRKVRPISATQYRASAADRSWPSSASCCSIACANVANLAARARRRCDGGTRSSVRLALGASRLPARAAVVHGKPAARRRWAASARPRFAGWGSQRLVGQRCRRRAAPWRSTSRSTGGCWRSRRRVALGTALIFGIGARAAVPARGECRIDALKEQGRAASAAPHGTLRPLAVTASSWRRWRCRSMLVVGAGLFMRTFVRLAGVSISDSIATGAAGLAERAAGSRASVER